MGYVTLDELLALIALIVSIINVCMNVIFLFLAYIKK